MTIAALLVWAIIDAWRTVMAVGHYEDRIIVVTHGEADVLPAWLVYALFDRFMPYGMVTTAPGRLWMLGLLLAGVAFVAWLVQARRHGLRLGGSPVWTPAMAAPVGRWLASAIAMVSLHALVALHSALTSHGGAWHGGSLDTRLVAYPLWICATMAVAFVAVLGARAVLRITGAQERVGYASALAA